MTRVQWHILISFALLLSAYLISTHSQASSLAPSAGGFQSSKEKCASALNSYLLYRHNTTELDSYKLQKLENQVEALCDGYQVRMVDNNGTMTGIIEAID